jgi:hypothetical protein
MVEKGPPLNYNFQVDILSHGVLMKRKWLMALWLVAMLAVAAQVLTVGVLKASLLAKPDFLSSTLASLKKGDKVEVLQESEGWYMVKGPGGQKGYLHKSAVGAAPGGTLSGLLPGRKGASQDEVALAAKGFNEANEKRTKQRQRTDNA